MIYAKFMPGRDLEHASRNRRELEVAYDMGFDVIVVSSDSPEYFQTHFPHYQLVNDGSLSVSYSMSRFKRYWLIYVSKFKVLQRARCLEADVVSCHDLDSLWLFWLAKRLKKHMPKLIYDSHEFELGRNKKRNRLQTALVKLKERFLIKRCAFSIMVNDVIADEVQRIHKLKERPVVVRNIPYTWIIDRNVCLEVRKIILSEMTASRDFLLMYHGGVTTGRGIEKLIELLSINDNVCLLVLGNSSPDYLNTLRHLTKEFGVSDRVLFKDAVPISELWRYVGAADLGMVTIPAIAMSYYYMLPNKFFENIQCETPVLCSDYPAIAPLVHQYGVGVVCDPTCVEDINKGVEKMRTDSTLYGRCKKNAYNAKKELCWEKERLILQGAFDCYLLS